MIAGASAYDESGSSNSGSEAATCFLSPVFILTGRCCFCKVMTGGALGLRDRAGLEQLRSAGLTLGERPYDFYTLETAEDLSCLERNVEAASGFQRPSSLRGDEFHSGQLGLRQNER